MTSQKLEIPESFPGKISSPPEVVAKKPRQTNGQPRERRLSIRQAVANAKKQKKLDTDRVPEDPDKPYYHYFDFIALKTDDIQQNDHYVMTCMNTICRSGVLKPFSELEWWSDGGGKVLPLSRLLSNL